MESKIYKARFGQKKEILIEGKYRLPKDGHRVNKISTSVFLSLVETTKTDIKH